MFLSFIFFFQKKGLKSKKHRKNKHAHAYTYMYSDKGQVSRIYKRLVNSIIRQKLRNKVLKGHFITEYIQVQVAEKQMKRRSVI